MMHPKIIVAAAVFFTILLSSAGCYTQPLERGFDRSNRESGRVSNEDGGVPATNDGTQVTTDEGHPSYDEPFGVLVTKTSPWNSVLILPDVIRGAFSRDMQVWLVSYEVQTNSVTRKSLRDLTIMLSYPRKQWELVQSPPQTGSIRALVALPQGWTPLFNVRMTDESGNHLLALDGRDDLFPRLQGSMNIWAVHPGGSFHPAPPVLACRDTHASEDQPAGVVPSSACPEIVDSCPVLYELTCTHL